MQSWRYMFWLTRAAGGILLITAAALLVPEQTRDMLEEISDANGGIAAALAFHFCLIILCFNLWHWPRTVLSAWYELMDEAQARASLAAPPDQKDSSVNITALKQIPRLLFLGGAAAGAVAALKSHQYLQAAIVLAWAAGGYWFFTYRLQLQKRILGRESLQYCRRSEPPCWARHSLMASFWRTGDVLLRHAPFGRTPALLFLIVAIVFMLVGTVTSFLPWLSGWWRWSEYLGLFFSGPSAAIFCLGLTIAPLTFLLFLFDQSRRALKLFGLSWPLRHVPVLTLLFIVIVATPWIFDLHAVRIVADKGAMAPEGRKPLGELFEKWVETCAPGSGPIRPVIVAVSGGASRAGVWAARILTQVDGLSGDGAGIFAVSSVSGGSLGAASYLAMRKSVSSSSPCFLPRNGKQNARDQALLDAVRSDALGPTLAASLFGDTPRALFGAPAAFVRYVFGKLRGQEYSYRGGDRAEALERAFEHNWDAHWPKISAALDAKEAMAFSSPYLSLVYDTASGQKPVPGMPLWLANGTDSQNGDRVITTPFDMKKTAAPVSPFTAARDALALLKSDVAISTAITNTARFPFLSPAGELAPEKLDPKKYPTQIIDGGYFENEGLETALNLARWLRSRKFPGGRQVLPIIVQATADAEEIAGQNAGAVVLCGSVGDDPSRSLGRRRPFQLFAPLEGLNSVRSGHSHIMLRQAKAEYCGSQQSFFHFYLYKQSEDDDIPLNWVLSQTAAKDKIWDQAFKSNCSEMAALTAAMQAAPPSQCKP